MTGCDPLKPRIGFHGLPVETDTSVSARQSRQLPVFAACLIVERSGNLADVETAIDVANRRQRQPDFLCSELEKSRHRLWHNPALLCQCPTLDKHWKV